MTDSEIESMWRTCKDRNAQVRILADLNVKSRKETLVEYWSQSYRDRYNQSPQ